MPFCSWRYLLLSLSLVGTAQAQSSDKQAWRECVARELRARDVSVGSVGAIGVEVAIVCKHAFVGLPNQDVDIVVSAVEKIRARRTEEEAAPIWEKLPPADKRL